MKRKRQNAIIQIIGSSNIETQDELLECLREQGFNTTQATVSRDIRELKVEKISYDGNKHKYIVRSAVLSETNESYRQVLGSCIISMNYAENIIVIKTVSGMAMAVGAAIDSLDIDGIMGCIAGDDTLFIAVKYSKLADKIIGDIENVTKYAY